MSETPMDAGPPAPAPKRSAPLMVWALLALLLGGVVGLGVYTFAYAEGTSYLSDDPKACVNCHVMRDVYNAWNHSSHKNVATCNDCHIPHEFPSKYIVKAIDGFKHSAAFTLNNFAEPIRISPLSRQVVEHNCLACHSNMAFNLNHIGQSEPEDCLRCHARVGHPYGVDQ